jgi:Oxygenase domain of the 2OGFeDO superfamily
MRTLWLKHDYKKAATKLKGKHPAASHADQTIDEDTKVIVPEGRIIAVLLCKAIAPELYRLAYELWKLVDDPLSNRATAVGTLSLARSTNKDGTPSPRSGVNVRLLDILEARQGILGFLDATPDQPCRKTTLTKRCPEMLDGNQRLIERVDALYAQHVPDFYAIQRAVVEKARRWRLWHTAFTTIYLAKNFRTAYHPDSGNLRGVITALMPMGKFTGGELVLPRWRIVIAFKPGDLLLFDPQQLHGNLPIVGERLSAAFYCEGRIADCGK